MKSLIYKMIYDIVIYEMSYLWNVLSMKCHIYGMVIEKSKVGFLNLKLNLRSIWSWSSSKVEIRRVPGISGAANSTRRFASTTEQHTLFLSPKHTFSLKQKVLCNVVKLFNGIILRKTLCWNLSILTWHFIKELKADVLYNSLFNPCVETGGFKASVIDVYNIYI